MEDLLKEQQSMDWVTRRVKCTLDGIYNCLFNRFNADVHTMNDLLESQASPQQYISLSTDGGVIFGIRDKMDTGRTVKLLRYDTVGGITVMCEVRGKAPQEFTVKPVWNEETATCELHVDGEPLPLWRISQRALSPLFFPQPLSR